MGVSLDSPYLTMFFGKNMMPLMKIMGETREGIMGVKMSGAAARTGSLIKEAK